MLIIIRTLLIGLVGGLIFEWLNIPLGWMLGALGATMVAAQYLTVRIPKSFRELLQPVLGVMLGSFFTPSVFEDAARWPEVILLLFAYVVTASLFGVFYFRKVARYDLVTAFFSSVPGGLSDLTLVGASMGANIVLLGLIHSIRVLSVVITVPLIISWGFGMEFAPVAKAASHLSWEDAAILVACGVVGYGIGKYLRIPAGATLIPLVISGAIHMAGVSGSSPPAILISAVQVVLGAYIGAGFVGLQWHLFRSALFHGSIWASGLLIISLSTAYIGSLTTGFGYSQLVLAFAPGGLAEMGLLTLALGIDVALVTTCHVMRIFLIYLLVPLAARRVSVPPQPDPPETPLSDG